ncbi:ATP-binding cassette sub-family C member 4-like isoform X1 [Schistocerca americana]|uniref:ATP-binding cassette sub-family C member 4-like isoform X1 n=1 Tax=Schistocerca americana TaxID=7009 RepID=UPI001F5018FA|nr:ATP-binding cassette sub-family C member 4-like isoform X1 [Schistocerca americana]
MDVGKKRTRDNPRKTANPLSVLFFSYTLPLFREGYSKDLTVDDLFEPLDDDTSARLGDQLEKQWEKQLKRKKPSLINAMARTFGLDCIRLGCLVFLYDVVLRMVQPLLLGYLLQYFSTPRTMSREEAMLYAAAIVIVTAISTLTVNHFMLGVLSTGMRMRVACCSLVYRKSLRLTRTALGETAAGQVVNLLSNDVSRFDIVSVLMLIMWCAPICGCVCAYFLYATIGPSAFVGIGLVLVIVPTQAYLGTLQSKYRSQTALKTDKRVRLTDEIISGMQVIKMYAWEKPFAKLIELARKLELKVIIKASYIRGIYMSFGLCTTRLALCCSLITFVLIGNDLTADKVFVVLTYFNVLAQTMTMIFVRGIAEVAEALVSIGRIEKFLGNDEITDEKKSRMLLSGLDDKHGKEEKVEELAVEMEGVTAKWVESLSDNTLDAVDLRVRRGQLVGVAGPVGAGKSSLLQAILGELMVSEGKCKAYGKLSYACQDPWVFAATVRQNILFGLPFDRWRYREVIRACALQRDLDLLPQGDLTVVGERGTSLSGGQKARVNLARAVYRDADIYLLDDPLSAVDTHVGKHLFEECIVKFLQNKTRILVTHQIQNLPHTDHVVVIDAGKIQIQGLYNDIVHNPEYTMILSLSRDNADNEDQSEGKKPSQTVGRQLSKLSRQISRTSTYSLSSYHGSLVDEEEDEEAPDMIEATTKGKVKQSPYTGYFRAGTNYFVIFLIAILFALAQILASGVDYFVSYWTTQEEARALYREEMNSLVNKMNISASDDEITIESTTTSQANQSFSLLDFVTSNNETNPESLLDGLYETETLIYMFVAITVGLVVIAFTRSLTFYNICMKSSRKLHDTMFTNLMRAPMRFFNTNPSGRILNRFSKDMGAVDEILPKAVMDATQIIMSVLGSLVIAVAVNWVYLIPIIVMGFILWFVRKIYLRSSMNIKRLEGMTKSPVFTHLLATLQGLTTIRAFGAESVLREEFDKHQDLHTSAWHMYLTTSQTFGFTLDVMSTVYMAFIAFSFLFLEDLFGGQMGLAITQAMSLTGMLQYGIRQSAEVANQMMSVERVMEYLGLEEEPLLEAPPDKKTPKEWPSEGEIDFRHVYMKYGPQSDYVIVDLNLKIKPREKVGVVGRTGAGKSSLISALFRLAFVEGELMIDGLDTAKVGLRDLRARLSIIPQDPVLFAGTLRFNLDPFDEFSDEVLWRTLDEVELRESLHDSLGLQTRVLDQGSNFSVGQRQLVCLARAILRDNRILMLDEATANVDNNTDSLIQKTIRLKFAHCTVLTVAHRLNTIIDSDKVLVMDAGRMVEFDHPHVLLQNEEGYFYKMVQQTGPSMAEQLRRAAEECYNTTTRL